MEISKEAIKELSWMDVFEGRNLSDVIFTIGSYLEGHYECHFYNHTSGKYGTFEEVTKGREKFILDPSRFMWAAKYNPEYNAVVITLYFNEKNANYIKECIDAGKKVDVELYHESGRFIIFDDSFIAIKDGEVITNASTIFLKNEWNEMIQYSAYADDVFGQFIFKEDITSSFKRGINISGSSGDAVRSFFKGIWFHSGYYDSFTSKCPLCDIFREMSSPYFSTFKDKTGVISLQTEGLNISDAPFYETEKMLTDAAYNAIQSNFGIGRMWFSFLDGIHIAFLQNEDGNYIYRSFFVIIDGTKSYNPKKPPLKYIERTCIKLSSDILERMGLLKGALVYFDKNGINEGDFKYAVKYLEQSYHTTCDFIKNIGEGIESTPINCDIRFAATMAYMPLFEKFYNFLEARFNSSKNMQIQDNMIALKFVADACTGSLNEVLKRHFGDYELYEKELHKALGIPKYMLDVLITTSNMFDMILSIKSIFESNKKYLATMDKKTQDIVIEYFLRNRWENDASQTECIGYLICLYGAKNCINYMDFIERQSFSLDYDWKSMYRRYIHKLKVLKDNFIEIPKGWRLLKEELEDADNAITPLYNVIYDKTTYANIYNEFIKQQDKWKEYCFEAEKFFITYPKTPSDLAEEGVKLKHCAKSFIYDVAAGKTMILFIRKKDAPFKPFFTIEIKDGTVRQCHGKCNCFADSDVEYFVRSFCHIKKIKLNDNSFKDVLAV